MDKSQFVTFKQNVLVCYPIGGDAPVCVRDCSNVPRTAESPPRLQMNVNLAGWKRGTPYGVVARNTDMTIFGKMKWMIRCIVVCVAVISVSCLRQVAVLDVVNKLPEELKECSGMVYEPSGVSLWTINDGGNANVLYRLDMNGTIENAFTLQQAVNTDWEDITADKQGNLYIGDFGNNDNDRKDLAIYKISAGETSKASEKITFYYPEQTQFPAAKSERFYDCEAFFTYNDSFYLFTKNRSKGFDGTTFIYKVPMVSGHHKAQRIGEFKTCNQYRSCAVTSAAISPDEKKVVLLSGSNLWLFEDFAGDDFVSGTVTAFDLHHVSQKEAVTFIDNDQLFIADERTKKTGGNLYRTSLSRLKNAH